MAVNKGKANSLSAWENKTARRVFDPHRASDVQN